MSLCIICQRAVFDDLYLNDGKVIHTSCLKSIQEKEFDIRREIDALKIQQKRLKKEKKKLEGLIFKVISIFSKPDMDIVQLEAKIISTEKNIEMFSSDWAAVQSRLVPIYDHFPTYPPDWDDRRSEVVVRDGNQCYNCGKYRQLHLHHVKQLSKGGSNKLSNLRLLCEACHSKKHGGREFTQNYSISSHKINNSSDESNFQTTFSQRMKIINQAISEGKGIQFSYKKPTDRSYKKRIVHPYRIVEKKHRRNNESTLCFTGYCELRNAKRTFALKRMRGLKIIDVEQVKVTKKITTKVSKISNPKKSSKISKKSTHKSKTKVTNKSQNTTKRSGRTPKIIPKKKTQSEDMYDLLNQHDIENLKLMGYDTDKRN